MALRTLRIFISSPGDLAEERLIARRVIGRLDSQVGEAVHLEPISWEYEPLVATASFQEQLSRPSEADVVIAILWSRLGTALPDHIRRADGSLYASGTEFEFDDAVAGFRQRGKPDILAYRKTARPALPSDPALLHEHLRQSEALAGFIAKWFHSARDASLTAAFHSFESPADFEELLEAHLTRLIEPHLPPGASARRVTATWQQGSPFRGLEAFEPQHTQVFFGRTGAAAQVLMKLRQQGEARRAFVLVVGMSGGGKSSLVRAGVLPLLLQPGVVGPATRWRFAIVRPSDGQGDLSAALRHGLRQPDALPALVDPQLPGPETPQNLAARIGAALDPLVESPGDGDAGGDPATCHLALVIDQFEEIFSDPRIGAAERAAFVDMLDALARSGRVWLIATLRSDAYPRLAELPALMALKEGDGQFDLMAPKLREIGQIIRLPAAAAGLRFEVRPHTAERLDDTIRDAAAKNPGALPLLQFLLEALYARRNAEDVLTFRAYDELGGVEGALAQRAEAVLASVSSDARDALPAVLRELVTFGDEDDAHALRRNAPGSAFVSPQSRELVDALVAARLLVSTLDGAGQAVISLAHEALLEFWPRLREWRERDRELLLLHARLASVARTWERQGRSADFLLARGKPLADARAVQAAGMRLSALEDELVAASRLRGRRFERLRGAAIAALAGLSVAAGVAAYRARVESARAQVQATTAQRTTDFMTSLFTIADPEENRGANVTAREILERGVTQIRSGLGGEQAVRAHLLLSMGQAYNGLGLYPVARGLLAEAVTLAEPLGGSDALGAHLALASNRYLDADYAQAAALYRKALAEAIALHGERHASVSEALCGLGDSVFELDGAAEAEQLYRRASAIDLALHGERHVDSARSFDALGRLYYFQGRLAEAEPLFRRALSIRKAVLGDRHAKVAISLNNLASLLFQAGKYDAAASAWRDALPIYRSVYGDEHREVATLLNNLGRVELMRGDLPAADRDLTRALAIDRRLLAADHYDLVLPLNSLAMVRMAQGNMPEARTLLDQALTITVARQHWMQGQVLANIADLDLRSGRRADGMRALADARAALKTQFGAKLAGEEAWRAAVLDSIAATGDISAGQFADAERSLLKAHALLRARFGEHGYYTDEAASRLVTLYRAWGREAQAEAYRRQLSAGR